MNLMPTCCFLTEFICPGIPGTAAPPSSVSRVMLWFLPTVLLLMFVHVFLDLVLLFSFPTAS